MITRFFRLAALACGLFLGTLAGASGAHADVRLPNLAKAAQDYVKHLKAQHGTDAGDLTRHLTTAKEAASAERWVRAIRALEIVVGRGVGGYTIWLDLANAWHAHNTESSETGAAAYQAFLLASDRDEKVETLALLGDFLYGEYQRFAKEIDAIRESLQYAEAGEYRDKLTQRFIGFSERAIEKLRQARAVYSELAVLAGPDAVGERAQTVAGDTLGVLLGQVQASDKAAAYCVEFNLPLVADAEVYQAHVDLKRSDGSRVAPEFAVKDRRLCVLGLRHGFDYTLKLKKGLPAQSRFTLAAMYRASFAVPDRGIQVKFRGTAFVLPSKGDGALPLNTVNAKEVDLELYRIADRSLIREVVIEGMAEALRPDRLDDLRKSHGELIWSGSSRVAFTDKKDRNADKMTNLPIARLFAKREEALERLRAEAREDGAAGEMDISVPVTVSPLSGTFRFDATAATKAARSGSKFGVYTLVAKGVSRHPGDLKFKAGASEGSEVAEGEGTKELRDIEDQSAGAPNYNDEVAWDRVASQWFVITDMGLGYYESRSKLYVVARSLETGAGLEGRDIQLVSRNNRILARAETNGDGVAVFSGRLARGVEGNELAAILAYGGEDFSFIDFKRDFYDMSRRGIEGREPPGAYDTYIYTDRGVYRPGERVQATLLLRDAAGNAVAAEGIPPLELVLRGSDNIAIPLEAKLDWQLGGSNLEFRIPKTIRLGTAEIEVRLGRSDSVIGSRMIQIDDFRPDRARLKFGEAWRVEPQEDGATLIAGDAKAQYLYGARTKDGAFVDALAEGLTAEVEVLTRKAKSPVRGCYAGFRFGVDHEQFVPYLWRRTVSGKTDEKGTLPLELRLDKTPRSTHPLEARLVLELFDEGGSVARRARSLDLPTGRNWIGIRLNKSANDGVDGKVTFDIVALDTAGELKNRERLDYVLTRERDDFIWHGQDGGWSFRADIARTEIERKRLRTRPPDDPGAGVCKSPNATKSATLAPGRYRVEVRDKSGAVTSFSFDVGYGGAKTLDPAPDKLSIRHAGEARSYNVGDTAEFFIETPFDGEALVAIVGDEVLAWHSVTTVNREAQLAIPIPAEWRGSGLYALATVFRRETGGGVIGPARALGAVYFEVDRGARKIGLTLAAQNPDVSSPDDAPPDITVRVQADGLDGPGFLTLFAVDEGVLSLTDHPAPDPQGHFFAQRALGLGILDSYGRIIRSEKQSSGDQGGGDSLPRPERLAADNYIAPKVVALMERPIEISNGEARVRVPLRDIGGFLGTLRLVGLAWSKTGVGAAETDILVRSPIVAKLGLPPYFAPGDRPVVPLTVHNVSAPDGDYKIEIGSEGGVAIKEILGPGVGALKSDVSHDFTIRLARGERKTFALELQLPATKADSEPSLDVAVFGAGDDNKETATFLDQRLRLRSPRPPAVQIASLEIKPGESKSIGYGTFQDSFETLFERQTVRVRARVARSVSPTGLNVAAADDPGPGVSLDRLVWRGMQLLANLGDETGAEALSNVVSDIVALQGSEDGSFLLLKRSDGQWERGRPAWQTALAVDFLMHARRAGKAVPDGVVDAGLEHLERQLDQAMDWLQTRDEEPQEASLREQVCRRGIIFATLILAGTDRIEGSDLTALSDACRQLPLHAIDKAMLGGALKSFGGADSAKIVLAGIGVPDLTATTRRDRAMLWALLLEAEAPRDLVDKVFEAIEEDGRNARSLPAGARAWLARGTIKSAEDDRASGAPAVKPALEPADLIAAKADTGYATQLLTIDHLERGLTIRNDNAQPLKATFTIWGTPKGDVGARAQGFEITRHVFNRRGEELAGDTLRVKQNEVVYVVLEGKQLKGEDLPEIELSKQVILIDLLPAGFDIVTSNLFGRDDGRETTVKLPIDGEGVGRVRRIDDRGDRWEAIIEPSEATGKFRAGYAVRATTVGTFVVPPSVVEDYASPELNGRTKGGELVVEPPA